MFERLLWLYSAGKITQTHLTTAVSKGWITQAQMDEIVLEVDGDDTDS